MDRAAEQRRSVRKITNLPVSYRLGNTQISTYTHDLSLHGMFLETDVLLERQQEFPLEFAPHGSRSEVSGFGRVVYLNPVKDEPGKIKSRGMGIELLDLPGKNEGVLRSYLSGIPAVGSPAALRTVKVRTPAELEQFIQLPFRLHREDPHWIPPLVKEMRAVLTEGNPFLRHGEMDLYLVKDGREPVGRIGAVIDHDFCGRYGEKVGYFGFFESIPDFQVAGRLFDLAAGNLRAKGMERMRGPLSPSLNDEICFLYEGLDSFPNVMMPYNPIYYNHFARGYGMAKVKDFLSYWVNLEKGLPEDLALLPQRAEQEGVVFRKFDMKHFSREIELLRQLNNQSWVEARHWGFVPITEAEMNMMAEHFRRLADPDIILFAEVGGEPAGYVLNLPNFFPGLRFLNGKPNPVGVLRFLNYLRHIRNVRAVSVGVLSRFARRNIALSLFVKSVLEMQRKGYASMEYVWVMEDNEASLRIVSRFGGRLYKRYRMYEVPLPENLRHVPADL